MAVALVKSLPAQGGNHDAAKSTPQWGYVKPQIGVATPGFRNARRASCFSRAAERLVPDMKERLTLPALLLIFVILAAGIVTAGCLYYRSQQGRYRTEVEHKLAAIADLKVGEISLWRKERWGDAGVLHGNIAFSGLVRRWLERPEDLNLREELQSWIGHIQATSLREGHFVGRPGRPADVGSRHKGADLFCGERESP